MTAPSVLSTVERIGADAVAAGRVLGIHVSLRGSTSTDLVFGESAPGVPAAVDDRGELRCAVKPLTTVLIGQAVDAGLLALDDPLARWAPDDAHPEVAALTLRQLLTHTTGLPNFLGRQVYETTFDDYVAALFAARLTPRMWDAQPIYGTAHGWHLLAWVLQRVHGSAIADLIAEHVTGPLGLTTTGLLDAGRVAKPLLRRAPDGGFTPIRDADPELFATRPNPGYGGFASTADLAEFYRALGTGALLRPETLTLLTTTQGGVRFAPGQPLLPFATGFFTGGTAAGFGDGWPADCFGHMGSIVAYYTTGALWDPSTGTAIAVRLTSVGRANNAVLADLGAALHADLHADLQGRSTADRTADRIATAPT